jgi:hypothetical protein
MVIVRLARFCLQGFFVGNSQVSKNVITFYKGQFSNFFKQPVIVSPHNSSECYFKFQN